ncbi:hypothetical protein EC919_104201 [Pseudomonas graminis]|nr:hypothetical protein EC919_104201 [Pseudomonas graminis]
MSSHSVPLIPASMPESVVIATLQAVQIQLTELLALPVSEWGPNHQLDYSQLTLYEDSLRAQLLRE